MRPTIFPMLIGAIIQVAIVTCEPTTTTVSEIDQDTLSEINNPNLSSLIGEPEADRNSLMGNSHQNGLSKFITKAKNIVLDRRDNHNLKGRDNKEDNKENLVREPDTEWVWRCTNYLKLMKTVKHWDKLLVALLKAIDRNDRTVEEIGQCFNVDADKVQYVLIEFSKQVSNALSGSICGRDATKGLIGLNDIMLLVEDKDRGFFPWWDKFIRQVVVNCKWTLIDKLQQAENDEKSILRGGRLQDYVNLAQNFDWLSEVPEPIIEDEIKFIDMTDKRLEDVANLARTKGNIEEMIEVTSMSPGVAPHQDYHEMEVSEADIERIEKFFTHCLYMEAFKNNVIDPVVSLIRLGYHDRVSDQSIASYQHIHAWLASIQVCQLMNHVHSLKMDINYNGKLTFRFKTGATDIVNDLAEYHAKIVRKNRPQSVEITPNSPAYYDSFNYFDDDLMTPGRWIERTTKTIKFVDESKIGVRHLKIFADYIKKLRS